MLFVLGHSILRFRLARSFSSYTPATHAASGFVTHVLVNETISSAQKEVDYVLQKRRSNNLEPTTLLSAKELIHLGAVWFLPAKHVPRNEPTLKPSRLLTDKELQQGDYLRVHHNPRRYPCHHDWKSRVVSHRDGHLVVNKPAQIQVHATVDNQMENMVYQLKHALDLDYLAVPQRLDLNTTGLLVLATTIEFARHFAQQLQRKTENSLSKDPKESHTSKLYRCLVQLSDAGELDELQKWVEEGRIVRHFLEPSDVSPKRYFEDSTEDWAECLLRLTKAEGYLMEGKFVAELEMELLTGRTHQIRGQLAALGFPIVGDVEYGSRIFCDMALQCCQVQFRAAAGADGLETFRLDNAWWTDSLAAMDATNMVVDSSQAPKASRPDLLPARVQLSPGLNKYVLVHAIHSDGDEQWFVKSASPSECGGPYHGNVAQDLREWIEAAGYKVTVTGGGRIDYTEDHQLVAIYGFSYAFGKGDHERAAALVRSHDSSLRVNVDNRDGIY